MYILDTHVFLWFVADTKELPSDIREEIENADRVFVSIASFWEMAIKQSIGKLELPDSVDMIMEQSQKRGIEILEIKSRHLALLKDLPFIHRDPFDRLLICQSKSENMPIITADSEILKYDVCVVPV